MVTILVFIHFLSVQISHAKPALLNQRNGDYIPSIEKFKTK